MLVAAKCKTYDRISCWPMLLMATQVAQGSVGKIIGTILVTISLPCPANPVGGLLQSFCQGPGLG